MGPLLVKALINFAKAAGMEPANIGHGISMAFGFLIVIVLASICQHQMRPLSFQIHVLTQRRSSSSA
jgi:hypothetical protein